MSDWEHAVRSELRNYRGVNDSSEFTLNDFQDFCRDRLEAQFPDNETIDASVRRNLQEFRDRDEIEFLGNGQYRILSLNDNRRMTADRFFGGVNGQIELLRSMYRFINTESPTKSELVDWIQSNADAEGTETIEKYLSFQRTIGMLEQSGDKPSLSFRAQDYLQSGDNDHLFDALIENVKGFEAILGILQQSPERQEELQEQLQAEYPDYQLPWGVIVRHVEWLQALGAVDARDDKYDLTTYGQQLVEQVDLTPLSLDEQPTDETPQVWIEKTNLEGREYKQQGDLQLGNAIYSPKVDKGGYDRYATMREASVGDIVLHLLRDAGKIVGVSQIKSELETDFEGLPEFDWTEEQQGYRRWLKHYQELNEPVNIHADVLDNPTYEDLLHQIREDHSKIFYNQNLGFVQAGYFTHCPPELLEIFVTVSNEFADLIEERGYPLETLPSSSLEPAGEYGSISQAEEDISERVTTVLGESNWLADQIGETIIRDWTDAFKGLEPGSKVSVERDTKFAQLRSLYADTADQLEEQAATLQSGSLNQLSPAETLFVVFLRELQEQAGEQSNANQIKLVLKEEYKLQTTEPDDPLKPGPENTDHPLVEYLQTSDVEIHKFTAPPDYWLTVFEYTAIAFERAERDAWNNVNRGDVIVFHTRSDPSWEDLDTQASGVIGAGIVRTKIKKSDDESWWYDEHEGGPHGDSFPLLLTFERLFTTGKLDDIDFTEQVIDKTPTKASAELEALTSNLLTFNDADEICRTVAESGFPRHQVIESLGTSMEFSKGMALVDALAERVHEVPPVALHKPFTGSLPESILDGLYFPDGEGKEILEQIQVALRTGKHLILTGPPGTGKTEIVHRVSEYLEAEYPYLFSGSQMTTATADWSTFDTVGGYMPDAESKTGKELEFSPGLILNRLKDRHENTQRNEPIVIDELNRADIDKAFGQLFTVLSGQPVQLPYTHEGTEIELSPADGASNVPAAYQYVLPESWRLFATLNTYDKTSLYEMSYAFMRRFAFIRVPAPTLPSDRTALTEIMRSFADGWAISVSDTELRAVGEVWRATNTSVEDRSIGPAVVKDILASVEAHSTVSRSVRLTQAVISFIYPQLEGVPKREKILRQIAEVPDVEYELLDEAARDMLQVTLNKDE
jgi:MoxR-like ATPase